MGVDSLQTTVVSAADYNGLYCRLQWSLLQTTMVSTADYNGLYCRLQ